MDANEIKFKTIKEINGIKYLSGKQLEHLKYYICHVHNIEKNQEIFEIIEDTVKTYFNIQNNISIQ